MRQLCGVLGPDFDDPDWVPALSGGVVWDGLEPSFECATDWVSRCEFRGSPPPFRVRTRDEERRERERVREAREREAEEERALKRRREALQWRAVCRAEGRPVSLRVSVRRLPPDEARRRLGLVARPFYIQADSQTINTRYWSTGMTPIERLKADLKEVAEARGEVSAAVGDLYARKDVLLAKGDALDLEMAELRSAIARLEEGS